MEKEKEVIGILESKFFYVKKKDFEEYRFAFAGGYANVHAYL
jgi:hypothetical protein